MLSQKVNSVRSLAACLLFLAQVALANSHSSTGSSMSTGSSGLVNDEIRLEHVQTSESKLATGMMSPDALIHGGLEFVLKAWECRPVDSTQSALASLLRGGWAEEGGKSRGIPVRPPIRGGGVAGGESRDILDESRNDKISKSIPEDCVLPPPALVTTLQGGSIR
jgi:hypothetical protein